VAYAQQTLDQSTQSPSTEQATTEQAATQTSAGPSNQTALEKSGLSAEGDSRDYSMDGEFAALILDAMPMALAIETARLHKENPAVQQWAGEQDSGEVLAADSGVLDGLWPVGYGLTFGGELAATIGIGGGAEVDLQVIRQAADILEITSEFDGYLTPARVGLSGRLGGAFDETIVGATIGAELKLLIHDKARATIPFDIRSFAEAILTGAVSGAAHLILGAMDVGQLNQNLVVDWLRVQLEADHWHHEITGELVGSADVDTGIDLGALVDPGFIIDALASQIEIMQQAIEFFDHSMSAAIELGAKVHLEDKGDFTISFHGSASLLAEQLPLFSRLGTGVAEELLPILKGFEGAAGTVELRIPFAFDSATKEYEFVFGKIQFALLAETSLSDGSVVDKCAIEVADVAGLATTAGPQTTMADVIGVTSGTSLTRDLTLPVDAERAADTFPLLDDFIRGVVDGDGVLASRTQLDLTAKATAEPAEQLAPIAASIQVPEGMSYARAVTDTSLALVSSALGGAVSAGWLEPYKASLSTVAADIPHRDARVQGTLEIGVGASASGKVAVGAVSKVNAEAGIAVDIPATAEEARRIAKSAATGRVVPA
jgi:hypothetical protein